MQTQFTTGPWSVEHGDIWDALTNGEPGIPLFRQDDQRRSWGRQISREEREANATLVAAAPELYGALDALVSSLSSNDEDGLTEFAEPMCAARAALTKARGWLS